MNESVNKKDNKKQSYTLVDDDSIIAHGEFAYLSGVKAAVITTADSTSLTAYPNIDPKTVNVDGKSIEYIPWGKSDDLPNQVLTKGSANPATSTGLEFNIQVAFGDGVTPCKREIDDKTKQVKWVPFFDNKDVNDFLENNDINGFLLEQMTDLKFFYNIFPELILSRDTNPSKRKIVELNHKEAVFSRLSKMDKDGVIQYHLYNSQFGSNKVDEEPTIKTPLLNPKRPALDLKRRLGIEKDLDGKLHPELDAYRFVMSVPFPTPGRFYYQQPYWYSIFTSGWYDYACSIPSFKNAMMRNQMTVKYIVYVAEQYWTELFASEGITDKKKQNDRRKTEYDNIQKFLAGEENTGKAIVSKLKYLGDKEQQYVRIVPVENASKGGEFIEDSEEASNIILFSLGVHSSLIGSFPSKGGTINGTEARELFTIKQALMKPIRDRLLRPLYVVKAINKWPEDIFFAIPNMQLTTLDKNTGAEKVISQTAM
jgi:hypothetical protein